MRTRPAGDCAAPQEAPRTSGQERRLLSTRARARMSHPCRALASSPSPSPAWAGTSDRLPWEAPTSRQRPQAVPSGLWGCIRVLAGYVICLTLALIITRSCPHCRHGLEASAPYVWSTCATMSTSGRPRSAPHFVQRTRGDLSRPNRMFTVGSVALLRVCSSPYAAIPCPGCPPGPKKNRNPRFHEGISPRFLLVRTRIYGLARAGGVGRAQCSIIDGRFPVSLSSRARTPTSLPACSPALRWLDGLALSASMTVAASSGLWAPRRAREIEPAIVLGYLPLMARTKRKPYTKSKRFDSSCRNHGGCPWCARNRTHFDTAARTRADADLRDVERAA